MKMSLLIVMTLFICINGIQQSNGMLTLQNLKAHQLFTKNVQFDQEFDEIPKVVVSIKQIIGDQYELYTRTSNINLKGFDLQIISSSNIDNIKINYLAINDNSLSVICENYQTKKDEIKVPFNIEHSQVVAFITGLKLQKNENVYFKLSSITDSQVVFQTKQKAMGLCLVFGNEDQIAHNQSIITTTLKDNDLEFNVENIEDSITLPLENQILSFDDIVSKLSIESKKEEQSIQVQNEEEQYLDIDSIQIETLGLNTIQQNIEDEVIQSVDIEFMQPEDISDQLLKIEENHIERVQEIIGQAVDEKMKLEELEQKQFLTQMNQVNVVDIQNIEDTIQQEIIIQSAYQIVPQTVDDLDMDALYKEFTLSQQLNDDLIGQQQQQQQQQKQQEQQQQEQQQQQQQQEQQQQQQQYQQQQQQQDTLEVIESVDIVQDQLVNEIQSEIIIDKTQTEEQKTKQKQLQIDVPLFDEDLQFDEIDVELEYKKEEKEQQVSPAQYIIDVYKSFANEESEKLNPKENEDHPFIEVNTETQTEEISDEVENELDGLRDGLEGVDFSLFFDEYSQPNKIEVSRQVVQNQVEQQNKQSQQKYEEPKQFKQPKEKIEDVMKDLQITTDITTTEDEKQLITQLKQKSAQLKKKLQEQYDAVPKLEQAKKQTEVSIHPIDDLYPKIESDSKINYEVESKYVEWSMNQDQKIKKIGLDLTEDDLRNPRFSLLQMDQKSELDIQKQINEFLGFDDLSFIMIKQNLRGR